MRHLKLQNLRGKSYHLKMAKRVRLTKSSARQLGWHLFLSHLLKLARQLQTKNGLKRLVLALADVFRIALSKVKTEV